MVSPVQAGGTPPMEPLNTSQEDLKLLGSLIYDAQIFTQNNNVHDALYVIDDIIPRLKNVVPQNAAVQATIQDLTEARSMLQSGSAPYASFSKIN